MIMIMIAKDGQISNMRNAVASRKMVREATPAPVSGRQHTGVRV